ncbi:hypothetical protein [Marinobacter orientalis]|uniref:Uncharacterized protein n=1 Tax=Marinobacter orientalis TaxID=1928859 RepID=A0A7Y0NKF7_9GAMM|nr:hypothetical protein [Marinobacter orientalis]NMT62814.1 hypothetical protein [Marinobacter orientalis]TGX51492.1 hypothetical protein DIT72_05570 [Marinobacter orientalis]
MKAPLHQPLFERVLAYLSACGIEPSADLQRQARALVSAVASEGRGNDVGRALELAPAYVDIPASDTPRSAPRMQRQSMGYWPNAR